MPIQVSADEAASKGSSKRNTAVVVDFINCPASSGRCIRSWIYLHFLLDPCSNKRLFHFFFRVKLVVQTWSTDSKSLSRRAQKRETAYARNFRWEPSMKRRTIRDQKCLFGSFTRFRISKGTKILNQDFSFKCRWAEKICRCILMSARMVTVSNERVASLFRNCASKSEFQIFSWSMCPGRPALIPTWYYQVNSPQSDHRVSARGTYSTNHRLWFAHRVNHRRWITRRIWKNERTQSKSRKLKAI